MNDKTLTQYLSRPDRLYSLVQALKDGDTVIIDEVQKAPQLLAIVHDIMESESYPAVQFVLTGSSARKLKQDGVDLLADRAVVKNMFPFVATELKSHFSLKKALQHGLVPLVLGSEDPSETLDSYIGLYLKEEVKQEGLVRSLESFSRFLEVMCFSHAEIVNLSNVARDSAIKRSTIDGYLSILEDLLLGYRIPSFKIKNRKQTVESEKFYFFDVGVFKSLLPTGPLISENQFVGQMLEGLVAQHLMALCSYGNQGDKLYFWRTQSGTEVDFVVYGKKQFKAIEVKSVTEVKREFLSGLKSFAEDYPTAECIFVYRGSEVRIIDKIKCVPVEKFLLYLSTT